MMASVPVAKSHTRTGKSTCSPKKETTQWEHPDTPMWVPFALRSVLAVGPVLPVGHQPGAVFDRKNLTLLSPTIPNPPGIPPNDRRSIPPKTSVRYPKSLSPNRSPVLCWRGPGDPPVSRCGLSVGHRE